MLIKHKKNCLSINGKQSVKLEKGIIEFKNFFKQIPVPFKIYDDFEYNLRGVESYEDSYTKKYQGHIPSSFSSYSVKKVWGSEVCFYVRIWGILDSTKSGRTE